MKNKKYIIASLISLSTLCSSCNDWLDLVPQDTQTSEQYWKTGKEVENVLASGYYYLRNSWQTLFFWSEARGIGLGALGNNDGAAQWDKLSIFDILPTDEYVKWEKMYKIISMANAVITYGPEVCDKDESFTENHALSLNAEAYFLRSYAYFTLVRNYREVPLILESFVTDETPFVKAKSTESEILTQLIKDLEGCMEYAKEYFPEIDADSKMNTKGRATRWAVKALLADIYLWRGESGNNGGKSDYERCIELCDEIIESGRIGLISGQRWFENFYPGNSNESIFEIQYDYNLSQTNSFLTIFNVNKSFTLNYNTILSFSSSDLRAQGKTYRVNSSNVVQADNWKFIGKSESDTRGTYENDQNWILYRLAEVYLMKAEAQYMLGDMSAGTETLKAITDRAGIIEYTVPATELDALINIYSERFREFISEGKLWYDMLRLSRRHDYLYKETFIINEILLMTSAGQQGIMRAKLTDPDAYYLPVPQYDLDNNHLLTQNPYYESLGN